VLASRSTFGILAKLSKKKGGGVLEYQKRWPEVELKKKTGG